MGSLGEEECAKTEVQKALLGISDFLSSSVQATSMPAIMPIRWAVSVLQQLAPPQNCPSPNAYI